MKKYIIYGAGLLIAGAIAYYIFTQITISNEKAQAQIAQQQAAAAAAQAAAARQASSGGGGGLGGILGTVLGLL